MYMLIYLVSCKLEEFQKCFKHRCEKVAFLSDYLAGDNLNLFMYVQGCLTKKQTWYTNSVCVFLYVLFLFRKLLNISIFSWFCCDFCFNSLCLKLLFLHFSEWSLFPLHIENVICMCEHLLYSLSVKDFCYCA